MLSRNIDAAIPVFPPCSYEGRVGAIFSEQKVFVTTPTEEYIFSPLRDQRTIRLRQEPHFGEEDPLYFPQPFSNSLPHLPLIPLPSPEKNNLHYIAWYRPTHDDFVLVNPEDESGSSNGLGLISSAVRAQLQFAIDNTTAKISGFDSLVSTPDGSHSTLVESDKYIKDYSCSLQWLMAQLNCACTFKRSSMTFALVQRIYLEMVARVDWLINYKPFYAGPRVNRPVAKVVGALVGNIKTAEHLWCLGVPLWLVRDIEMKDPNLRVDKWIEPSNAAEGLDKRTSGFRLSFSEADPPNLDVWSGMLSVTNFDRYTAMSRVLRRAATAHLYEEEPESTPSHAQASASTSGSTTTTAKSDKRPRKRMKTEITQPPPLPPPNVRSKFEEVDSDIAPPALKMWCEASKQVGVHFNPNAHKSPLGYFLPDAQMIAALGQESGNFQTRTAYLEVWLKLRHVLLYQLKTASVKPLGPSHWRTLLGIERLQFKDTKSLKQKAEVEEMLMEALRGADMQHTIDISRLNTVVVKWQNSPTDISNAEPRILKEILWELSEASFRYELLVMDRRFYHGLSTREEREPQVLSAMMLHFKGALVPSDLSAATEGFASSQLFDRRMALWGLLMIMDDWNGAGTLPVTLRQGSGLRKRVDPQQTDTISLREVDEIEYAVVHHYVSAFAITFGRAPILPHRL
ncbi:hypothetical protein K435DRAFT_859199 [Dendrothele bispora CBS 962.96]|uniref:Uncharacterized protein n=1 Tax=Dendrothele bispora (strain CBS 962.96) TaxID=1314807 RepID=A0A4S8M128_DENBC|nr:hypothetical protein K435DRAFT_859199 [Dendrothele bispora CBS 962.96]